MIPAVAGKLFRGEHVSDRSIVDFLNTDFLGTESGRQWLLAMAQHANGNPDTIESLMCVESCEADWMAAPNAAINYGFFSCDPDLYSYEYITSKVDYLNDTAYRVCLRRLAHSYYLKIVHEQSA